MLSVGAVPNPPSFSAADSKLSKAAASKVIVIGGKLSVPGIVTVLGFASAACVANAVFIVGVKVEFNTPAINDPIGPNADAAKVATLSAALTAFGSDAAYALRVLTALFTVALTVPDTAGVADCVGAAFNAALVIAPITAVGLPLRALLIRAFCVAALLNELVKVFVVAVVVLVDGTPSLAVPVKALAAPPNMAALSAAVIPLPSTGLVPPMLIGLPVRSVTGAPSAVLSIPP